MRAWEFADDILYFAVPAPKLRDWAQWVANQDDIDNSEALRTLHASVEAETDSYAQLARIVAAVHALRWEPESGLLGLHEIVALVGRSADDNHGDPFYGRWLAEAALTIAEETTPGLAAEMHTLAWRCVIACREFNASALHYCVSELLLPSQLGVVLDAHLAPIRIATARHLQPMLPTGPAQLLEAAVASALISLAVAAGSDRRSQAVEYFVDRALQRLLPAIEYFSAQSTAEDDAFLSEVGLGGLAGQMLAEPIGAAADALLAAGEARRALHVLERADVDRRGGAIRPEVRLVRSLFTRMGAL